MKLAGLFLDAKEKIMSRLTLLGQILATWLVALAAGGFFQDANDENVKGPSRKALAKEHAKARKTLKQLPFQEALAVLKESKDRDKLFQAALSLCRDSHPEAIPTLMQYVQDPKFFDRMDTKDDYAREDTRLEQVLLEMVANSGAAAERRARELVQSGIYIGEQNGRYTEQRRNMVLTAYALAREPRDMLVRPIPYVDAAAALDASKDPDHLLQAAVSLCRDKKPDAIAPLMTRLKDTAFLSRLDPYPNYARHDLRIGMAIAELAKSSGRDLEERLLDLAADKAYQGADEGAEYRRMSLVYAARLVREPTKKLLAYLDTRMTKDSALRGIIVETLLQMCSADASKLVEKQMLAPGIDPREQTGWVGLLPEYRDDPAILRIYRALLSAKNDEEWRRDRIALTLFDYPKPTRRDPNPPKPKPWPEVSTESLREFLKLSDLALKFGISDETKVKVEQARKEIHEVLDKRKSEKK